MAFAGCWGWCSSVEIPSSQHVLFASKCSLRWLNHSRRILLYVLPCIYAQVAWISKTVALYASTSLTTSWRSLSCLLDWLVTWLLVRIHTHRSEVFLRFLILLLSYINSVSTLRQQTFSRLDYLVRRFSCHFALSPLVRLFPIFLSFPYCRGLWAGGGGFTCDPNYCYFSYRFYADYLCRYLH